MNDETRNWKPFALLLIDVQNDFWPRDFSQQYPQFPDNMAQLLHFCRTEGIEVIHVRAAFKQDMSDWMTPYKLRKRIPCVEGTEGIEVLPFAREQPGEKVIIKHSFDGFQVPELLAYVRQAEKRFVFVAGLITTTCVLFTATSAMQNGFLTAIIEDCCADEPERHEYTLSTYSFIFQRTKLALLPSQYEQWTADLQALDRINESTSQAV